MTRREVLQIDVPFPHHADGGYGALSKFMDAHRLAFPLRGTSIFRANPIDRAIAVAAFRARLAVQVRHYRLVHILYPDAIVNVRPLPRLPVPTVLTLHTPLQLVDLSRHQTAMIRQARAVIVLSQDQLPLFHERFPDVPVVFIPHGIDVSRYPAGSAKAPTPSFVVAGSNLRDWSTLNRILTQIQAQPRNWAVHLVGVEPSRIDPGLIGGQVILHERLDTDAYQQLLATSWAMLMPVLASTANNAALESRAAGITLIGSRVPGLKAYEDPSWTYFDSAEEAVSLMSEVGAIDQDELAEQGLEIRKRALEVDWTCIATQTADLYRRVVPV